MDPRDLERQGDAAREDGDVGAALEYYKQACSLLYVEAQNAYTDETFDALGRVSAKYIELDKPLMLPADQACEVVADEMARATEEGDLVRAAYAACRLGEIQEEMGDREEAESSYRQAVALTRMATEDAPDLMLKTFKALAMFLSPAQEALALAFEVTQAMLEREMRNPIRDVGAAELWCIVELERAIIDPSRMDYVLNNVRVAINAADDACIHETARGLRLRASVALRMVGRIEEADEWQAEGLRYQDWTTFPEQEIPGHFHAWDVRGDKREVPGHVAWDT